MKKEHISGNKKADVLLFALSTCVWCNKTKKLLSDLGIDYHYVYVDLADKNDLQEIESELKKWNPAGGFPTMVIDNKECIVGFQPDEIKKRLV